MPSMAYKTFKNRKAARRLLSQVSPNLFAVDKHLKPCYLWDAFKADLVEIQNYLNDLHAQKLTDFHLSAFSLNETIFVTECENLRNYLESFSAENVTIVDVSETKTTPSVLASAEKQQVLDSVLKITNNVLSELQNPCDNREKTMAVDLSVCNITTLYGVLLGYPVFYWYKYQNPDSEFTCLSMVPLIVYQVTSNLLNAKHCLNHELFSFSIPEEISNKTDSIVQKWFDTLTMKSQNKFCHLALKQRTVTLSSVSM